MAAGRNGDGVELVHIKLKDYKGVEADIDMAPMVVLFGRNNVGKTNVLEAFGTAVSGWDIGRHPATDVFLGVPTQIQLARVAHGINASDADWLATLLQFGGDPADGPADLDLGSGPAPLVTDGDSLPLNELAQRLQGRILEELSRTCDNWDVVASAAKTFVSEALTSEWFGSAVSVGGIVWLLPPPNERSSELLSSAAALMEASDLWPNGHLFSRTLEELHGDIRFPMLLGMPDDHAVVVQEEVQYYTPGTEGHDGLLEAIEESILRCWGQLGGYDAGPSMALRVEGLDEEVTITLSSHLPGVDPWLKGDASGGYRVAANVQEGCRRLSTIATELAPNFIADDYDVRVEPVAPPDWRRNRDRRVRVLLVPHDTNEGHDLVVMGAGSGLWASYSIREAMRELERDAGVTEGDPPRYYLIDEPEQHLHPLAQQEAAAWLAQLARDGATIVLTTHSPAFLNIDHGHVEYIAVTREGGVTRTESVSDDLLGLIDRFGPEFGFSRSDVLQMLGAVLVVEGEHDLEVLKLFFDPELQAQRVWVLPLRGAKNTKRLIDSEFLGRAGVPIYVLLDNLNPDRVQSADSPEGLTDEERLVWSLRQQATRDDITFLPYEEPDILCALPLATVGRRYPHLRGMVDDLVDDSGYWGNMIVEWREAIAQEGRTSFKQWAASKLGLGPGTPLVNELLSCVEDGDRPSLALRRAMQAMVARGATAERNR